MLEKVSEKGAIGAFFVLVIVADRGVGNSANLRIRIDEDENVGCGFFPELVDAVAELCPPNSATFDGVGSVWSVY